MILISIVSGERCRPPPLSIRHWNCQQIEHVHTTYIISFVCLLGFFVPLGNFSLMGTSSLPVKGCKFWHMLGTYGHWAVRVVFRAAPTVARGSVYNGHLRGPVTLTPITYCLAVQRSLPDLGLSRLAFELPTLRLRGERSNRLSYRRDLRRRSWARLVYL